MRQSMQFRTFVMLSLMFACAARMAVAAEALAVDPAAPSKERAHECYPEMRLAGGPGPGVTRVLPRLVLDLQLLGAEFRLQPPSQLVGTGGELSLMLNVGL